jgi:hypothetical protein
MEPNQGIKAWQWVVTAIVIIVLIVVGIMVFGGKKSETPSASDMGSTTTTTTTGALNRIVMSDQYPGNVVYLSSVQLQNGGWVVIQKDNAGQPGAIIGSAWFDAGINPGKVTVTSPIVDGGTYYAVLYSDNGDQKFDPTVDMPLKDASGNIIMNIFHGSASAGNSLKG